MLLLPVLRPPLPPVPIRLKLPEAVPEMSLSVPSVLVLPATMLLLRAEMLYASLIPPPELAVFPLIVLLLTVRMAS